ncbi:MAG: hypothetical protein NVSMB25_02450 [Thermoleophilaceae bacterium]
MLIDTRHEPPRDGPGANGWRPNALLWSRAAAALGCFGASYTVAGFGAYLLLIAAFVLGVRAVTLALPYGRGLGDHRQ